MRGSRTTSATLRTTRPCARSTTASRTSCALFAVAPEVVAHDLHPEYLSTKYALERENVELVGVQHHHAHLAACLAEHGVGGPAIGAIFDGTGYGTDGTMWGGELLHADLHAFKRVGSLHAVRLPGGERAIKQPWRMAGAWLLAAGEEGWDGVPPLPAALRGRVDPAGWRQVLGLARSGLASPLTSSIGRLFDAVAALCGVCPEVNYEGQAAIELEAACDPSERGRYPVALQDAGAVARARPARNGERDRLRSGRRRRGGCNRDPLSSRDRASDCRRLHDPRIPAWH